MIDPHCATLQTLTRRYNVSKMRRGGRYAEGQTSHVCHLFKLAVQCGYERGHSSPQLGIVSNVYPSLSGIIFCWGYIVRGIVLRCTILHTWLSSKGPCQRDRLNWVDGIFQSLHIWRLVAALYTSPIACPAE